MVPVPTSKTPHPQAQANAVVGRKPTKRAARDKERLDIGSSLKDRHAKIRLHRRIPISDHCFSQERTGGEREEALPNARCGVRDNADGMSRRERNMIGTAKANSCTPAKGNTALTLKGQGTSWLLPGIVFCPDCMGLVCGRMGSIIAM